MPRHKWAIKIETFHCDCKRSCYPKKVSLPSAAVKLLTYPDIEQSCVGLGSSWDPATSPIQPETPGARPSSRPWLPCQLPFVGTSDVERWIRGIDQLIGGTREQPGSWQPVERKEISTHPLEATIHFFYWLWLFIRTNFVTKQYLQLAHFSNPPPLPHTHTFKLHWKIHFSLWQHVL